MTVFRTEVQIQCRNVLIYLLLVLEATDKSEHYQNRERETANQEMSYLGFYCKQHNFFSVIQFLYIYVSLAKMSKVMIGP